MRLSASERSDDRIMVLVALESSDDGTASLPLLGLCTGVVRSAALRCRLRLWCQQLALGPPIEFLRVESGRRTSKLRRDRYRVVPRDREGSGRMRIANSGRFIWMSPSADIGSWAQT